TECLLVEADHSSRRMVELHGVPPGASDRRSASRSSDRADSNRTRSVHNMWIRPVSRGTGSVDPLGQRVLSTLDLEAVDKCRYSVGARSEVVGRRRTAAPCGL